MNDHNDQLAPETDATDSVNPYELKQQQRRERLESRAAMLSSAANATHERARHMASGIPFGQPIHVGHHSERRDRNYRDRIHRTFGKAFDLHDQAEEVTRRAEVVGTAGISSDDPEAIRKLREELAKVEASQGAMKAANAAIRKHKTVPEQLAALLAQGLDEADAAALLKPDFMGRIGFPGYALSNNNANARRIRQRIKQLECERKRASVEIVADGYTYREDTTENRVMFFFEGKPADNLRALLKREAFKWSPTRGAWVRQLSAAGRYAGAEVRAALDAIAASPNVTTPG